MPEKFYIAAKGWVKKGGKTLVLQDKNQAWDLPGGRMEGPKFGKFPFHNVLVRELFEEIGLKDARGKLIGISQWTPVLRFGERDGMCIFVIHYAVTAHPSFEPILSHEHQDFCWVDDPTAYLPKGLWPEEWHQQARTCEAARD